MKGRCPRPLDDGGVWTQTFYKLTDFSVDVNSLCQKIFLAKKLVVKSQESKVKGQAFHLPHAQRPNLLLFANQMEIQYYKKLSIKKSLNLTRVNGVMLYPLEVIFTLLYKRF